jgi:hypothetical protein
MSLADNITDQDSALAEVEAEFGTTMMWAQCDSDKQAPLKGVAGANSFIVRKSAVKLVSPNRIPENGDTLTDSSGQVYMITSANGQFDQVMSGGFTTNSPRNTDNTAFYRLILSGPEENR